MKTIALIEKGKDGTFGVYAPTMECTIIGEGNTVEAAISDFENSAREMIASYTDLGEALPDELVGLEFAYKYDVASVFDFFDCINVTKFAKKVGINASQLRHYKQGNWYISAIQAKKIENALHDLGRDLLAVSL